MKKLKFQIIEHESFVPIMSKDENIFLRFFGPNKFGIPLSKISTLVSRINTICEKLIPDFVDMYPDKPDEDGKILIGSGLQRFKGDIFEIFINGLILLNGNNARIGIYNYEPEAKDTDYGVDGKGIGNDGKPLTVQIKFRSNKDYELKERDIKQFPHQSIKGYGVDKDSSTNLVIFTTCKGVNAITNSKVFFSSLTTINGEMLRNMVDDNTVFWKNLLDLVETTIVAKFNKKILESIKLMEINE